MSGSFSSLELVHCSNPAYVAESIDRGNFASFVWLTLCSVGISDNSTLVLEPRVQGEYKKAYDAIRVALAKFNPNLSTFSTDDKVTGIKANASDIILPREFVSALVDDIPDRTFAICAVLNTYNYELSFSVVENTSGRLRYLPASATVDVSSVYEDGGIPAVGRLVESVLGVLPVIARDSQVVSSFDDVKSDYFVSFIRERLAESFDIQHLD